MAVIQILTVTEVAGSVNIAANTSKVRVVLQSTQSGDSYNDYTRHLEWWTLTNDEAKVQQISKAYTLPKNSTKTILDETLTVKHRDDGTGIIRVYTKMDTRISAGVIEKYAERTLTTIPRASAINYASDKTLGEPCYVSWTPKSTSFRYKLNFKLGNYSYTTGVLHPNATSSYAYTGLVLPLEEVAKQLPNSSSGAMTATLYTYSDANASVLVGSSSANFTVTIPENASTKPNLTMALEPITIIDALSESYLRGRSKIKATFTGEFKYGAVIDSYRLSVGNKNFWGRITESDILDTSGEITVTGIITDSRGFTNTVTQTITVYPYDKPSVVPYTGNSNILCARCLSDGTLDRGGTYLLIKIGRRYSKVYSGATQINFCKLSYSYKTDAQDVSDYSEPISLIPESATGDYVSVILPNVVGSITTAYNIRLIAEDTAGESDIITITVPTAFVTFHAPKGGHGFTLGGYHDPDKVDVFDCKFDAEFEGVVKGNVLGLKGASGYILSDEDLNDYKTPGVYAITLNGYAEKIKNMPIPYAGLVRVYASIGQTNFVDGQWLNLMQEYQCYDSSVPTFRRRLYNDDQYNWSYGEWTSDSASSIETENGKEVWRIRTRKGTDIYDLKVSESGISYSKNGTTYWTK